MIYCNLIPLPWILDIISIINFFDRTCLPRDISCRPTGGTQQRTNCPEDTTLSFLSGNLKQNLAFHEWSDSKYKFWKDESIFSLQLGLLGTSLFVMEYSFGSKLKYHTCNPNPLALPRRCIESISNRVCSVKLCHLIKICRINHIQKLYEWCLTHSREWDISNISFNSACQTRNVIENDILGEWQISFSLYNVSSTL